MKYILGIILVCIGYLAYSYFTTDVNDYIDEVEI